MRYMLKLIEARAAIGLRQRAVEEVELEGLRITPIEVNHAVPTLGFLIEDDHSAIVIPSDTGPTAEIWSRANKVANLKATMPQLYRDKPVLVSQAKG